MSYDKFKGYMIPFIVFFLVSISYTLPLLKSGTNWGQMDWDQFTFWNAASRQAILYYHQFPLWNPYSNGGNVALAHPHAPFLSPFYIFVLIFGPIIGLKIQIVVHLLIGMLGMFLLAKHFNITRYSSYLPPLVYMLSSTYTLHLAEGHLEWLSMAFIPWLFLCFLKSIRSFKYAIGSIIFLCLMILAGSVYVLAVVIILLFVYAVLAGLKQKKIRPLKLLIFIFIGGFLLSAVKLIPMLEFIRENPRRIVSMEATEVSLLADIFLSRDQETYYQNTKWTNPIQKISFRGREFEYGWHEYGAYIGFVPLVLAIIGLFFYFKQYWPLFITGILSLWISLGGGAFYNLWGMLHKLPIYNSLHVPSRFIMGFIFVVSLFSGLGLSKLENIIDKKRYKFLIGVMVSFIFLDLFLVNCSLLKNTFIIEPPKIKRNSEFRQRYKDFNLFPVVSRSSMYAALLNNSGIINSYEVSTVKQGRIMVEGERGYKGEVYLLNDNGQMNIIKYTPNYIETEVKLLNPDTLVVNQNFYTGWKIKGINSNVQPYKGLISAKVLAGNNKVIFYYLPASFVFGCIVTLLSISCLSMFLLKFRRSL